MGIINAKNLFRIRGRVGNVVLYEVNGKTRVRSTPETIKDPKTPAQRAVRSRLVATLRFYQRLKPTCFAEIWQKAARDLPTNGYALFMKTNLPAYNTNRTVFDFSMLHLSVGELYPLFNSTIRQNGDGSTTLQWEFSYYSPRCHASDRLMIGMLTDSRSFSPRLVEGVEAVREDCKATFRLPEMPDCGAIHLYCFFSDANRECYSNDSYHIISAAL